MKLLRIYFGRDFEFNFQMIKKDFEAIFSQAFAIESCHFCGSLIPLTAKLCNRCLDRFLCNFRISCRKKSTHCSLNSQSLFQWDKESDEIDKLVSLVKGNRSRKLLERLCPLFVSLKDSRIFEQAVFVGVEGRVHGPRSHSYQMASILSEYMRRCFIVLRHRGSQRPQREQGRAIRRQTRFYSEKALDFTRTYKYIFVDDIITTGATAQASYEALGKPQFFKIWTIFDRCLSNV